MHRTANRADPTVGRVDRKVVAVRNPDRVPTDPPDRAHGRRHPHGPLVIRTGWVPNRPVAPRVKPLLLGRGSLRVVPHRALASVGTLSRSSWCCCWRGWCGLSPYRPMR